MIKVGAITIGQSPRTDVTQDILPLLGDQVELLQAGGLDGLTREEIEAFQPGPDDYVLISRLRDGSSAVFAERYILPRLQNCIDQLEQQGVEIILFLCTGDFPAVFHSKVPLIFPCKVLNGLVPALAGRSRIAVVTPHAPAGGSIGEQMEGICFPSHRDSRLSLRKPRGAGPGSPPGSGNGRRPGGDGLHWIQCRNESQVP